MVTYDPHGKPRGYTGDDMAKVTDHRGATDEQFAARPLAVFTGSLTRAARTSHAGTDARRECRRRLGRLLQMALRIDP